jgi:transcriptional regulator with XRE-family HTH domain
MSLGATIQAWRLSRNRSVESLADQAGLPASSIESIESGETDPSASTLDRLGRALGVPAAWLYGDPKHLEWLTGADGDDQEPVQSDSPDPVLERILLASRHDRGLYTLLTVVLLSGDPKLIRAAEMSLRSLAKQSKQATVPWQSRPPGHFEPPSD